MENNYIIYSILEKDVLTVKDVDFLLGEVFDSPIAEMTLRKMWEDDNTNCGGHIP